MNDIVKMLKGDFGFVDFIRITNEGKIVLAAILLLLAYFLG